MLPVGYLHASVEYRGWQDGNARVAMSPPDTKNATFHPTNNALTLATAAYLPRFDAGVSLLPIPGKAEQKWLRGGGRGHQQLQAQSAGRPSKGRRLVARQFTFRSS
jgi:hypothetical protein